MKDSNTNILEWWPLCPFDKHSDHFTNLPEWQTVFPKPILHQPIWPLLVFYKAHNRAWDPFVTVYQLPS